MRGPAHFLVELDVLYNFESKGEVAKQHMYAQEPDETEISQHVIERQRAIIAHDFPERLGQYARALLYNLTYAISASDLPCCFAIMNSLILDFWMRE